jgi:hypothetical protein
MAWAHMHCLSGAVTRSFMISHTYIFFDKVRGPFKYHRMALFFPSYVAIVPGQD